ncbi:MAG: FAD-dependent oxidoreductase [Clostridia bacterium]|nr:FAD-dependent oxidoreductase [Clostridia bacterium]
MRRKNMKKLRLTSLFLVLVMVLSLAACGGTTTTPATATQAPATAEPEPAATLTMADGTYTAEGSGFSLAVKIPVTVEVKDNEISSITVGENGETMGMIAAVENLYIPRVIEYQSLAVDAITGATASSVGVRMAVADCLGQAGADASLLYTEIQTSTAAETYDVDVVVVGMGSSGTCAALAAAESGVNVLAIDKAGKWGGTGAVTSGPSSVNPPSLVSQEIAEWADPIQGTRTKAAGENFVDAEALYNEWINYTTIDGVQGAKTDLIRLVIDKSGETCDWLTDYGFEFEAPTGFVGGKWAIFSRYVGNKALTESFFAAAYENFTEMGGRYMLETEATDLIMEDGKAVGVVATKADGTSVTINAKAVILCTGGFAGSAQMQEEYIGEAYPLYGMYTNDGKMVQSAIDNGAGTYSIGIYPMSHFVAPTIITRAFSAADNDIPYGLICTAEGMAVNRDGDRFIDETGIAMDAFYQGNVFYYIYSSDQIDILREQGLSANAGGRYLTQGGIVADTPLSNIDAVIDQCVTQGNAFKADSLNELAAAIGGSMTAESLKASAAGYNPENDAFGKDAAKFDRLGTVSEDAEYYVAFVGAPYIYSVCGGLDVNASLEVLDTDGNVIPGLYACGTDSMGVLFNEDKAYTNFGGCAQGYCFVSGKTAAENAAEYIK